MKFLILFTIAFAWLVAAKPISRSDWNSTDALNLTLSFGGVQITGLSRKSVNCNNAVGVGATFRAGRISTGASLSLNFWNGPDNKKPGHGNVVYPHQYRNFERLGFLNGCTDKKGAPTGTLYEYPIFPDANYRGGDPGPDRIVLKQRKRDAVYCGLMTHRGVAGNSFKRCAG